MMQREKILIASCYKHLSAIIKIKIIRIKPVLLAPREPKAQAIKTGINFKIFNLIFVEN